MLRILFASVLVLHSLLHLIGVSKAWNKTSPVLPSDLMAGNVFSNVSKISGAVWLVTSILLLSGAAAIVLRKEWFWIPVAAALVMSQVLIMTDWHQAKYGTIVNLALVIAVVLSAAATRFDKKVKREVDSITNQASRSDRIISEEMVSSLPGNVQRWMHQSSVIGRKTSNVIRVVQKGSMRTKPDGKWMPFEANQYFTIDPPAFVWVAKIKAAPLFTIAGRDRYQNGEGNMLIKPLYIFTAADSRGEEINQGTLLRYMAEMVWFPQAAVSKYLKWEFIDDHHAKVTMDYGGTTASGIYAFNDDGGVAGFEALRYGDFGGTYRKERWSVATTDYKQLNGIIVGYKNEVTWKLEKGDFMWLKLEITNIE